jgi:hypothetical protein
MPAATEPAATPALPNPMACITPTATVGTTTPLTAATVVAVAVSFIFLFDINIVSNIKSRFKVLLTDTFR